MDRRRYGEPAKISEDGIDVVKVAGLGNQADSCVPEQLECIEFVGETCGQGFTVVKPGRDEGMVECLCVVSAQGRAETGNVAYVEAGSAGDGVCVIPLRV